MPAEVAVAVSVGGDHRRADGHRLEQRQAEALVDRGLHEHRGLVEELVHPLVAGALEVARAVLGAQLGLHSEHPQLRPRLEPLPGVDRERKVLERQRAADREHHVVALGAVERAEVVQVDPRRNELGLEAQLGQSLAVVARDRDVAKLLAIAGEDAVLGGRVARVVRGLDVLDEVDGDAARDRGAPDPVRGLPPGGDLDGVLAGERGGQALVAAERADGHLEREPVGRSVERVELDGVAAPLEAVEMLEHVAVAAADAGVLRHVDDPEAAVGVPHVAAVEPVAPLVPEVVLRAALALADLGAARGRLDVGQPGAGLVPDLSVRPPTRAGSSRRPRRPSGSPRRTRRARRSVSAAGTCAAPVTASAVSGTSAGP